MFLNKKIKIIFGCFICAIVITTISIIAVFKFSNTNIKTKINNVIEIKISGAVNNPGIFEFYEPTPLREVIFKADVKSNADLETLNLDEVIHKSQEINVPFKINKIKKIKWSQINNVNQLVQLGIAKSIAIKLVNYRRENETTIWEDILSIKGIGQITLNQLKQLIDLS